MTEVTGASVGRRLATPITPGMATIEQDEICSKQGPRATDQVVRSNTRAIAAVVSVHRGAAQKEVNHMDDAYINTKRAAEYLRVTPQTVTRMLRNRVLKGTKCGSRWFTTLAWCDELLRTNF